MNKNNPLAYKEDLTVADLENEKFIIGLSNQTHEECKQAGFVPNISFESNDPAYVRKYIEMGLGVAFIPAVSWRNLFSGNVVLKNVGAKRKTYACVSQNKHTKKSVTIFLEYLLARAEKKTQGYKA